METLFAIAGVLFAALLALLGLQKRKVGKQEKILERQRQELVKQTKETQVGSAASDAKEEADKAQSESQEDQEEQEEEIEDAQTDEDVIKIGNGIVDGWNAGGMPDDPPAN
jgi:hypothetical protein